MTNDRRPPITYRGARAGRVLRVMSYNVREGARDHEDEVRAVIGAGAADLVLLQEVLDPQNAARIGRSLGLQHYFVPCNARQRNLALLSRLRVTSVEGFHPFPLFRGVLLATVVLPDDSRLTVVNVHLGLLHEGWRRLEIARMLRRIARYRLSHPTSMALIGGDFNSVAPGERVMARRLSPLFRAIIALQFARWPRVVIPAIRRAGYVDAWRRLHPTDPGYTMPTPSPALRLDYFFLSPPLAARLVDVTVVTTPPADRASDHYPLVATFDLEGGPEDGRMQKKDT